MQVPTLEIIHLVHTLKQVVIGFMDGANGNKPTVWREHVFADKRNPDRKVIVLIWARVELQEGKKTLKHHGRGTPHTHVLWWFIYIGLLGLERSLCGDLDMDDDPVLKALASVVQRSSLPTKAIQDTPTEAVQSTHRQSVDHCGKVHGGDGQSHD